MTHPNSDYLCNNLSMFGLNDDSRFSDCVLIIEIETHPKPDHLSYAASHGDESSYMEECSGVKKLPVNSKVLAEKSPFFHDLFTTESEQRCVSLSIHASEETAVMELVNFLYRGTLTATTEPALLDVLKLADKFQVASCMRLCASILIEMPMTIASAAVYLSLVMADEVPHLVGAAKQFADSRFANERWNEIMKIPLAGMEAILSSDSLEILSEDELFGIAQSWVTTRYSKVEDQRKIFSTRLGRYIRFPYMSSTMLKNQVLGCDILDKDFANKVVVDALYFKTTNPYHHYGHDNNTTKSDSTSTSHRPYVRRAYYDQLVTALEFEFPCQEVVVHFDVCTPVSLLRTEEFKLGEQWFRLVLVARDDRGIINPSCFALFLESDEDDGLDEEPLALEYEFAVRSKCTKKFLVESFGPLEFTGSSKLYEAPLLDFEAGKSLDGVLYFEFKLRRR